MNYTLKKYVLSSKTGALRLGYSLRTHETTQDTVILLSNGDSDKVALAALLPNIFGDIKVKTFLIDRNKYNWAKEEGFDLDQMINLKSPRVFLEVDPRKLPNYLL